MPGERTSLDTRNQYNPNQKRHQSLIGRIWGGLKNFISRIAQKLDRLFRYKPYDLKPSEMEKTLMDALDREKAEPKDVVEMAKTLGEKNEELSHNAEILQDAFNRTVALSFPGIKNISVRPMDFKNNQCYDVIVDIDNKTSIYTLNANTLSLMYREALNKVDIDLPLSLGEALSTQALAIGKLNGFAPNEKQLYDSWSKFIDNAINKGKAVYFMGDTAIFASFEKGSLSFRGLSIREGKNTELKLPVVFKTIHVAADKEVDVKTQLAQVILSKKDDYIKGLVDIENTAIEAAKVNNMSSLSVVANYISDSLSDFNVRPANPDEREAAINACSKLSDEEKQKTENVLFMVVSSAEHVVDADGYPVNFQQTVAFSPKDNAFLNVGPFAVSQQLENSLNSVIANGFNPIEKPMAKSILPAETFTKESGVNKKEELNHSDTKERSKEKTNDNMNKKEKINEEDIGIGD